MTLVLRLVERMLLFEKRLFEKTRTREWLGRFSTLLATRAMRGADILVDLCSSPLFYHGLLEQEEPGLAAGRLAQTACDLQRTIESVAAMTEYLRGNSDKGFRQLERLVCYGLSCFGGLLDIQAMDPRQVGQSLAEGFALSTGRSAAVCASIGLARRPCSIKDSIVDVMRSRGAECWSAVQSTAEAVLRLCNAFFAAMPRQLKTLVPGEGQVLLVAMRMSDLFAMEVALRKECMALVAPAAARMLLMNAKDFNRCWLGGEVGTGGKGSGASREGGVADGRHPPPPAGLYRGPQGEPLQRRVRRGLACLQACQHIRGSPEAAGRDPRACPGRRLRVCNRAVRAPVQDLGRLALPQRRHIG